MLCRRLPVEGTVPDWLDGALRRNGPAQFEVGGERVAHWFDGLTMVHRDAFDECARATLPHTVPFGFHGRYFRDVSLPGRQPRVEHVGKVITDG